MTFLYNNGIYNITINPDAKLWEIFTYGITLVKNNIIMYPNNVTSVIKIDVQYPMYLRFKNTTYTDYREY